MRIFILIFMICMFSRSSCEKCTTPHCIKEARYLMQSLKLTEDPCVDFYSFACGNFVKYHEVPEENLGFGAFEIAENTTKYDIKGMLEEPFQKSDFHALKQAKRMYQACMNKDTRDTRGMRPLRHMIKKVGGWPLLSSHWNGTVTWHDVAHLTATYGIPLFFDVSVKPSENKSATNVIYLGSPSMRIHIMSRFIPQRAVDYMTMYNNINYMKQYLLDVISELHGAVTQSIKNDINEVFQLADDLQPWSISTNGSEISISSLTEKHPEVNWLDFFQTIFQFSGVTLTPEHIVKVPDWSQLENILSVFNSSNSTTIQNYIVTRLVMYLAPETSQRMHELMLELYSNMTFISPNYTNWQYCIGKVQDSPELGFGGVLAYQYSKRKFYPEHLEKLQQVVNDLKNASEELLIEGGWFNTETIRLMQKKFNNITMDVGFPNWMKNVSEVNQFYKQLVIRKKDHFGNVVRLRRFMHIKNLESLADGGFRVMSWFKTPFIINAFYEVEKNTVTVPGGIIQHPFFSGYYKNSRDAVVHKISQGASDLRKGEKILQAIDYGRFGFLVGHELSHAFDYRGHLYNQNGILGNNWTIEMEDEYNDLSRCFSVQYDRLSGFNKESEFDQRALGEDIADNGGIRKAYRAFKKAWSRDEGEVARFPGLPNFTPEQLFFLGYATNWCYIGEEAYLDVHSFHRDRTIYPLSNMKEFSIAWNCSLESPMNPINKCVLL